MKIEADSPDNYIEQLPEERKQAFVKLRKIIQDNLPYGFTETISYGMIGYVVPHSLYPGGYHVDPKLPLPFLSIASQKNFIAFYHMGIYADAGLYKWFVAEYPKHCDRKLDMGKSCIRFKKSGDIPFELLAELVKKITPADWIKSYEEKLNRSK